MESRYASLPANEFDRLDRLVQAFQEEWARDGHMELEQFWAVQQRIHSIGDVDSQAFLAELIKADLRCRFDQGQIPTVASYLERFPSLQRADTRVLSLIYEEFCLSEERGHQPAIEAFCERYPNWKDSLASQLRYHRLFSAAAGLRPSTPCYPNPGDDFEEFHLESLLGTGGTSRVFLAKDNSLGGKRVVLKISSDRGQEPRAQGPLDHPHIMPVNSVTFQTERQLRGLSMPFRAGLPLDEIIGRVVPVARPRKAIALWNALIAGTDEKGRRQPTYKSARINDAGARRQVPVGDGWSGFPVRGSYAQGAAWIVMSIARALHYAHGMRTFHRDVKPANVLLTLQHGPQLLDFNLADSPHSVEQAQAALRGGTLPYMAPEQIEAFLNPELWGKVEAKADIYSLGLVFRELLTGVMPELPPETLSHQRAFRHVLDRRPLLETSARRLNPTVPHALDAIVAKCLAVSPADRYSDAHALAQDLDRFLRHQPLVTATNPSRRERARNWTIRHKRPLIAATALVFVCWVWLYPAISDRLKKPITTLPSFQSAVDSVGRGDFKPALDLLLPLAEDYPRSSLLQLYLALASDGESRTTEAGLYFSAALDDVQFEDTLVEWKKDHPNVVDFLEDFADNRFNIASNLSARNLDAGLHDGEEEDRKLREPFYRLAKVALRLAARLNPSSERAQRLLAKAEDFDGEYASADGRIAKLIDKVRSADNEVGAVVNDRFYENVSLCYSLRAQIRTDWADFLRGQGPSPTDPNPFDLMSGTEEDLKKVNRFLDESNAPIQVVKVREFLQLKTRAMLTLSEVEMDRGLLAEAGRHLDRATMALNGLDLHSQQKGLAVPNLLIARKRLSEDRGRLNSLRENRPAAANAVPARPSGQARADEPG